MSNKSRVDGTSKRSLRKRTFDLVMSSADRKKFFQQIVSHRPHVTRAEWARGVRIGRLPQRRRAV